MELKDLNRTSSCVCVDVISCQKLMFAIILLNLGMWLLGVQLIITWTIYIYNCITTIFLQDIKLWVVKCHGCEEIAESVQQKSEITMMGTVKHKD